MQPSPWEYSEQTPPSWLIELMQERLSGPSVRFVAQLLWQRGLQEPEAVLAFLDPDCYRPASPWAFGAEMERAIARLQQALEQQAQVYIWGDFDADGITATAVLWEGLGQFFQQNETLHFFIPNRLKDSHGLSINGLDQIAARGGQLIVTCDNGSADDLELDHARTLGLDVIITDHHLLPAERPRVTAFLNSRQFAADHPLAQLSGVAVAYKLVEALYETLPQVPQAPLETLLDLVAIGLISDLVQLSGDCRYLAQTGLAQLRRQISHPTRPGVAKLLKLCRKTGDRPTDISFGLGPRINALSRIQGEAREGVELLTSRDPIRAEALAESAEWTNTCRKEVQQQVLIQAEAKLAALDLAITPVIILSDPQWTVGVLGIVASQLAQTYGRPVILLSEDGIGRSVGDLPMARGSARSIQGLNLYELMQEQAYLLDRFGGHPFAVGLSLSLKNLPLFSASIQQDFRQRWAQLPTPSLKIDLELCLADVVIDQGAALFRALQQLEPYGMGNPTPLLLVRNCHLEQRRSDFSHRFKQQKVKYKKVRFDLRDDSTPTVFPSVWWGHEAEDLPEGRCDVVFELEYARLYGKASEYHARLVAVRPSEQIAGLLSHRSPQKWLLDWRSLPEASSNQDILRLEICPYRWEELDGQAQTATARQQKLALAYPTQKADDPMLKWSQLVGLAKYAARKQSALQFVQIQKRLGLGEQSLALGLEALRAVGFKIQMERDKVVIEGDPKFLTLEESSTVNAIIQKFVSVVAEEQFQQSYFQRAPVQQLQKTLEQRLLD